MIDHHPIVLLSSLHCLIGLSITDVDAGVVLHVFDDPLLSYIVIMYKILKMSILCPTKTLPSSSNLLGLSAAT